MKAASLIALLCLGALEVRPQGQAILNNRVSGVVVAPIFNPDPANPELVRQGNRADGTPSGTQIYAGPPLQGLGFTAQLFGGTTNTPPASLQALTPATRFLEGDLAGFMVPPDFPVTVPGVPQGTPAKLQLRVWDNNNDTLTNWQQVSANGWVARGESLPFISRPLGSTLILPPNLEGLQSFNVALPAGVAALLPSGPANLQAAVVSDRRLDLSWEDTATNELGFRVERSLDSIGFALIGTTSSNLASFSDDGLRPGLRYYYRVRATNSTGESAYSNTNFAATRTPFAQWQVTHFTPVQLTNPLVVGPDADPDTDGLRNIAEYTFTREPLSADLVRPGNAVIDRLADQLGYLALSYSRSKASIDATVRAEVSSNLSAWQSGTNFVTGPIPVSQTETTATEKFRDNTAVSASPQRFLQLNVTYRGVPDSWETNAPMPIALDEVACAVIGSRLYVVGGGNPATLAFDIPTARWTNLGVARPFAGNHHAAEVFNGKLYLLGGLGGSSEGRVQIYDPSTNGWSVGEPMPFAAGSCASAVINGQIFVAGGFALGTTTNGLARYNPILNVWLPLAPMLQGRHHTASGTDGGLFYAFGGRAGGNFVANGSDTVQIYNPATDTWTSSASSGSLLTPLPQFRSGMVKAVFLDGDFYVIGGETATGPGATAQRVYNRVDIYHPASNTWRQGTPMLTARHGIYPVVNGSRIYVASGGVVAGASSSALLEVYIAP